MIKAVLIPFCFLLFGSRQALAQYSPDTAIIVEEPAQDSIYTNEEDNGEQDQEILFLDKADYTGDSFTVQQRVVPDSLVKNLQGEKSFWYANAVLEKEEKQVEPAPKDTYLPVAKSPWFQTLIWFIIIGGFAAFLMIYLGGNNIGLFRKKSAVATGEEAGLETEDIFSINYQKEIDKASSQGNYRLAVRLLFLRLLKNMSEKDIIRYQQDKTNLDYLVQLQGTSYYTNFFRVTRNYEYSWYGKFEVSEETYRLIRKDFDHVETSLR